MYEKLRYGDKTNKNKGTFCDSSSTCAVWPRKLSSPVRNGSGRKKGADFSSLLLAVADLTPLPFFTPLSNFDVQLLMLRAHTMPTSFDDDGEAHRLHFGGHGDEIPIMVKTPWYNLQFNSSILGNKTVRAGCGRSIRSDRVVGATEGCSDATSVIVVDDRLHRGI